MVRGRRPAFEAPTVVAGLDDVAVMGQPVEQRGGHLSVANTLGHLPKARLAVTMTDVRSCSLLTRWNRSSRRTGQTAPKSFKLSRKVSRMMERMLFGRDYAKPARSLAARAAALRRITLRYVRLRGEGSIPVPLHPPYPIEI